MGFNSTKGPIGQFYTCNPWNAMAGQWSVVNYNCQSMYGYSTLKKVNLLTLLYIRKLLACYLLALFIKLILYTISLKMISE